MDPWRCEPGIFYFDIRVPRWKQCVWLVLIWLFPGYVIAITTPEGSKTTRKQPYLGMFEM